MAWIANAMGYVCINVIMAVMPNFNSERMGPRWGSGVETHFGVGVCAFLEMGAAGTTKPAWLCCSNMVRVWAAFVFHHVVVAQRARADWAKRRPCLACVRRSSIPVPCIMRCMSAAAPVATREFMKHSLAWVSRPVPQPVRWRQLVRPALHLSLFRL